MGSWSKNQPESIVLPWIRKYGFADFYVIFCLAALIFQHRQKLFPRWFVFQDRLNKLDRRPGPKSLRQSSLRSRFPIRPSFMLQEERPHESRISWLFLTLSLRGLVFLGRLNTLDRRQRPKLLRRARLRSRFPMSPSSLLQEEQSLASQISWLFLTLSSRGLMFPDRLNTLDRRQRPKSLRAQA